MSSITAQLSVSQGALDALPPAVRALFGELQHAGALEGADVRHGEAGREQRGTRVRFSLRIQQRRVIGARFLAYGCPYTLAACEWIARELEAGGGALATLSAASERLGPPSVWLQRLQIPPARLGRLLIIEDALQAVFEATDAAVTHDA
jgi:NifU-like protein involved in Fe-S cluster formation